MNIDIWVIETSNEQLIRGSYTEINFSKNKAISGRIPFFFDRSIFYFPFYLP